MLTTKRLLLGLLVLGIVGMHGLVTSSSSTAAHHGWIAASAVVASSSSSADPTTAVHVHDHDHARVELASDNVTEDDESTALALCMALLLAFGVVTLAVRRTTWVADAVTHVTRIPLPRPPVLRDRSPVPRFTVMRC